MSEPDAMHAAALAAASAAAMLGWSAARLRWTHALASWVRMRADPAFAGVPWPLRLAGWIVRPVVPQLARRLPGGVATRVTRMLRRAGVGVDGGESAACASWLLLPLPGVSLGVLAVALGPGGGLASMLLMLLLLVAPWLWLRSAARRRELEVLRELPFHLDMLALALESGATLALALHASLPRAPVGPLRDGLQAMLRELQAGRLRVEAIEALQRYVDFPAVAPFTAALQRAERSGAGLAGALRIQAEQRRHERFHRAESLALQAPVRMLGPLVLCIFPGTFLVLAFVVYARSSGP